jgi:threonylcarbamoyladenosine tRNA methylthiotransferase MtaB
MKTRIAIETLGCKLNQAESEALAAEFASAGCRIVACDEKADVYILNTCTVTHIADRKSRHLLRMAKRLNPDVLVVAAGCYAERSAGELRAIPGVDMVVNNRDKGRLFEIISQRLNLSGTAIKHEAGLRTRAFIKAQDGCNRRCAYCIVPLVRGPEKSLPADAVLDAIKARVARGAKEVVLTGTEIGSYSFDGLNIKGLIERILGETRIERLRISSLQPYEITPELLALWQNPRLCPHFHISLQSGADSVLARMQRGYSTPGYEKAAAMIRRALPDAAITTDIIVGFPGESDAEFQETVDFCRRTGFARIHVFPYSARPGTAAAAMSGQVKAQVKRERTQTMLALAKESAGAFRSRFLGRTLEVLWEQKSRAGIWGGYSAGYIRVYAVSDYDLTNAVQDVILSRIYRDGVLGEIVRSEEKSR